MSVSSVGRLARYFFRSSGASDNTVPSSRQESTPVASEPVNPHESYLSILRTGSMLSVGAELIEEVPRRLGPYRIIERIGEGGMGVVYLAEQDPPLVRHVAIKLARTAIPGDRALARLESERQTLAAMNHPNIAHVFDAGSAPDSRPYFVMEHVAGQSITAFCDARCLGIEARLELFVRVCNGVQHAHVNAVIHRDLKPSNILVTTEAGSPIPKIIDFGLAKVFDSAPRAADGRTQFGEIIGTPEYMSPEQAALDGRPVDTRTDVYSLGVVLYELLVGTRPFERNEGPEASFVDLCRRIREEDPERPSARVARTSDVEAARQRSSIPPALGRALRGDLDAIVCKALAKDPAGRYATPSDMAADVDRFLQHRPVSARAPGLLVRAHKAVRRNRRAAVAIAALSATLAVLAVVGSVQALRAQRASARAEAQGQVAHEVSDFLLTVLNPELQFVIGEYPVMLSDTRTRESLELRINQRFADNPDLRSQLLLAVGSHLEVSPHRVRDLDMLTVERNRIVSLRGPDSPEALAANERLAGTHVLKARFPQAELLLRDVLERRRRQLGPDHPETWRTTALLAQVYKVWLKHDRAVPLFEEAIAGLERLQGPDDRNLLTAKVGLSGSYLELRHFAETQALLEPAIDRMGRVLGERDQQTQIAFYNLGIARAGLGDVEGAFRYLRESIERGWTYPFSIARDSLLMNLHGDPRFEALDRAGRLNYRDNWDISSRLAEWRIREGRLYEAERLLRGLIEAIERLDRNGAGGRAVAPRNLLAKCLIRGGRFEDAERLLLQTLAAERTHGSLELLAQCDIAGGRRESALARIAEASSLENPVYGNAEVRYAQAQTEALRGRTDEALRLLIHVSELGFDDVDRLEHDLAFKSLRKRTEFAAIVKSARRHEL